MSGLPSCISIITLYSTVYCRAALVGCWFRHPALLDVAACDTTVFLCASRRGQNMIVFVSSPKNSSKQESKDNTARDTKTDDGQTSRIFHLGGFAVLSFGLEIEKGTNFGS